MFGRKKKKAQERKAAEQHLLLERLERALDEADQIDDAGEKLYKLEELRAAIQTVLREKQEGIRDQAEKKGGWVFLGSNLVQVPLFFTAAVMTGVPPLVLLCVPALGGTFFITNKSTKNTKERLEQENADFLKSLEVLESCVSVLADRTLDGHLEAIARSAKRDMIFERFPDVKTRFGVAAAKKMAASDSKPKPPEPDDYKPGYNS
jgi:hypothetical protein